MISAKNDPTHNVIELRLPSQAEWVGVARLAIAGIASRLDFGIEDIEDLKLAVAEAYTNCIQHAASDGEVRIECAIHPDKLVIAVHDQGKGFNGAEIAPRKLGEPQERGLGVFLIRTLMDDVSYEVDPRRGTRLTMIKHVRPQQPAQ
ncbi:MAG: ATP-binding protein [Candidatus Eremiobacteraeota bacterium]|nr:ATP-binding protein [Candidatus Eremiobacteraeota bacterium]MBV8223333.1 ATP-binding protein [Candidatus Eremiobacteraeota bacterium]